MVRGTGLSVIGKSRKLIVVAVLVAGTIGVLLAGQYTAQELRSSVKDSSRLMSVQLLPETDGTICPLQPVRAQQTLLAALQREALNSADAGKERPSDTVDRPPDRVIRDTYPTYSAIAMDQRTGEVMMEDENLFGIKVFNRLDNTPAKAAFTEPKRIISGPQTKLEFNCGLYVDPVSGDVYSVNNDTTDNMVVFPYGAEGDRAPSRELHVPHGSYGIAVDEAAAELYITVEHQDAVVIYHKTAQGEDKPIRTMAGDKTQLEDPHGIGLDMKDKLMFVTNHGNARAGVEPNTYGRFDMPSITVYPMDSKGDTAPLRIIQGAKTQLNWPAHVWVDEQRGEFYIANDAGDSVLVFKTTDSGDVAPTRMIKGPKTQLRNPMGVFLDAKNDELWVSNMGNHRATVFARDANGDVEPKRAIRSAPPEKIALAIGNPGAVGYDSKREEILVPNCVAHPQIAIFSRMSKENAKPSRLLAGQKTLLSRTMHDVRYDAVHDEVFVTNPFSSAILVFRGGADGEEAPIRIIQGPHTQLGGNDRLEVDPDHNEILTVKGGQILVFKRDANGDVAPIRIVQGKDTTMNGEGTLAVDPIHNILAVAQDTVRQDAPEKAHILFFERTASGNVKPLGMIKGPKTEITRINQLQIYAPTGWLIAAQPGFYDRQEPEGVFVGIWSIHDNGDVAPRWKLGGPHSVMVKPRGVVVDEKHKALIVADMRLNAVLTFSFPELF